MTAFYPSPLYAEREMAQVCDGIIICGDAAILIEYEGNTFSVQAMCSYEPQRLGEEIERKLDGTEKRRKGVRQLVDTVSRTSAERTA